MMQRRVRGMAQNLKVYVQPSFFGLRIVSSSRCCWCAEQGSVTLLWCCAVGGFAVCPSSCSTCHPKRLHKPGWYRYVRRSSSRDDSFHQALAKPATTVMSKPQVLSISKDAEVSVFRQRQARLCVLS